MATGACHLELVDDLSADHFIMALKRHGVRDYKKYAAIMELTLYGLIIVVLLNIELSCVTRVCCSVIRHVHYRNRGDK